MLISKHHFTVSLTLIWTQSSVDKFICLYIYINLYKLVFIYNVCLIQRFQIIFSVKEDETVFSSFLLFTSR